MHSFEVSLWYERVDRTTLLTWSASLKMYFGQRFHTPMKLQKNVFNSKKNNNTKNIDDTSLLIQK
jgi:hypothetical protein